MSIAFIYPQALWLLALIPLVLLLALAGPRRPTKGRFRGALILRTALLLLIILALAGIQVRTRADLLTAVFVLDASDSIPPEERGRGEGIIRLAIEEMPQGDKAAVVVFGEDALVERLASEENRLAEITSIPVTARSDLASALQLAMALFPDEGAKRLVLLSDGRENLGHAIDQADIAAVHGVEMVYIPLPGPEGEVEVLVETLNAPADLRQGQGFELEAVIQSTARVGAVLRVFDGEAMVHSREVILQGGVNRFGIPVETDEPGFRSFRVQVLPDVDTRLQNNTASAFTVVHGPPRILIVEGTPGEGGNLRDALQAGEMEVSVVPPESVPTTITQLVAYDALMLVNVPAPALPETLMETLPVYVRELGKGLIMVGGENAYGAGGYLRSPIEEILPVYMDTRAREETANLALVLAVDKSGSMGRCHCDDPDLRQTYTRAEVGQPKVDIAKAAIMRAASAIGEQDFLGVIAFDSNASWAFDLAHFGDYVTLEGAVGGMQAEGQTNLRAGVEAAMDGLAGIEAKRKHIILLTDGWSHSGDITPLVREMNGEGITFSVVAAGGGSAEYLEQLAQEGEGRYYPAQDILRVPEFFLKETVKAAGEYVIEEPFYPLPSLPGPVMRGLDVTLLPPLLGYNGTSPKNTARIDLATPRGDPLLATWQHGLGRTAAWTSDLKGQWGMAWVTWEDFAQFATQLVGWTLPAPQVQGVTARATFEDDQLVVSLEALDQDGRPLNFLEANALVVDPDLESRNMSLSQTGAGVYDGRLKVSRPGTYLIRLDLSEQGLPLGQQTLGLVVPYSPEYRSGGVDLALLSALASRTGGGEVSELDEVFTHDLPAVPLAREIWRPLLLVVALLFPLDVAIRRVMWGRKDAAEAWQKARAKLMPRRYAAAQERVLGRLFQARDRAREREERVKVPPRVVVPEPPREGSTPEQVPPQEAGEITVEEEESESEDTFERLMKARDRVRRK